MEHLINLNFAPGGLPATVHVSQYDDTIRQLRFQLWFGRSKVEVPSGASVRVDIKKPDGHIVLVNGTVNSSDRSIVTVPTTKQMTAVPGGSRGTLVVSSTGDKRISSAIFILQVHRDHVEDGDASDSDLSMLQDAIDQTAANATAAQAAATAAQQAAASFQTDTTLTVTGAAADAKKTGDEITALKADLEDLDERVDALEEGSGSGLTAEIKAALLACFAHVVWDDDDPTGQSYIDDLEDALYPPVNLVRITAVYTQSGTVYNTDTLDSLKTNLVVTAVMSDSTTQVVTNYTLTGTLIIGTSTITANYGGKSAVFTVEVSPSMSYTYSLGDLIKVNMAVNYTNNVLSLDNAYASKRRAFCVDQGAKAIPSLQTGQDTEYYPIPIPSGASSVTVSITPNTQFIGVMTLGLSEGVYTQTGSSGWQQGSATLQIEQGSTHLTVNCKYNSAGTNYPTEPSELTVVFL